MAEGAEGDGGVADVGVVCEHDFQDANVSDDGSGDGGDEEKDGGDEEEGDAEPAMDLLVMGISIIKPAWCFNE